MMPRAAIPLFVLALSAVFTLDAGRAADRHSPVLVELFTSQGCSACPPADQILTDLSRRSDVIALTLPITYWDMLGWRDTLASMSNTQRQKAYADRMRRLANYTPQIIVGGADDVVGNKRERVFNAVARHAGQPDPGGVDLSLSYENGELQIEVSDLPSGSAPATIWVMRVLSRAEVPIGSGENRDMTLVYTNVVRDIVEAETWETGGKSVSMSMDLEPGEHDRIAVVVQRQGHGPVLTVALWSPN
jgi:hypothetical protein